MNAGFIKKQNEGLKDEEGRKQKFAVKKEQLKDLIDSDLRTTVWELASELSVLAMTIFNHLRDIWKLKKLVK